MIFSIVTINVKKKIKFSSESIYLFILQSNITKVRKDKFNLRLYFISVETRILRKEKKMELYKIHCKCSLED